MNPMLKDPAARRRWDGYFRDVDRLLASAGAEAASLRLDLQAHVADSMAAAPNSASESECLEAALARLGRPIDYLRPLLADELIERGTRTYSPLIIGRGLLHAILAGSGRAAAGFLFGFAYLLLAIFIILAVLKPLWGDHVGLFRWNDGTMSFGVIAQAAGARELLGWWSIPISLAIAAALYVALTLGLRAARHRR